MKGPQVSLSIIAIAVLLLGSGSAVAHHYPPVDYHANWTIYEGGDGYMEISEDYFDSDGQFTALVYVEVIPGTGSICDMPFFSQPWLLDSDGWGGENTGQNDGYYRESCEEQHLLFPLFKDRTTHMPADSNICLQQIGFVWLRSDDNAGTYQWDTSHDLWVLDPNHNDANQYIGCEEEEGFPMALVLGAVVTVIAILGGIFYWRKDGVTEEESEIPVQQTESSEPAAVNDQDGGLLEEKESNQEKNEGVRNSKFCPSCGLTNDSNGKFCKDCGTDLSV